MSQLNLLFVTKRDEIFFSEQDQDAKEDFYTQSTKSLDEDLEDYFQNMGKNKVNFQRIYDENTITFEILYDTNECIIWNDRNSCMKTIILEDSELPLYKNDFSLYSGRVKWYQHLPNGDLLINVYYE
jgi:fibrillarin-like rRNA methylase